MKTIVYRAPHEFVIEARPEPRPGARQILVRPLCVGLCVSDKHWYEGYEANGALGAPGGMVGGHEFSAEIVEVGEDVEGFRAGQLVSVDPRVYCGECLPCRGGVETLCSKGRAFLGATRGYDGGLAELCVVPDYACYPVPDNVTAEVAACVEPMTCATRSVRHCGLRIGDNVVLLGGEDYNLYATKWLRSAGANRVILVDPSDRRRNAARSLGAHEVLCPDHGDIVAEIRSSMPFGADIVMVSLEDYVEQSAGYVRQAFEICRPQGTVVMVRAYGGDSWAQVAPMVPWRKEITIRNFGSFFGSEPLAGGRARGDWQLSLDALGDGRMVAPPLGVNVVKFSDITTRADVDEIFRSLPGEHVKTLISMT
jgi:threonine dehydrogenase-like Zn-dependent dehydrogenase